MELTINVTSKHNNMKNWVKASLTRNFESEEKLHDCLKTVCKELDLEYTKDQVSNNVYFNDLKQ